MASPSLSYAFLFLSLLLCTAYGVDTLRFPPAEAPHPSHHHHHHHPVHPPTLPPTPPPSHPHPPPPPPSHPHPPPPPPSHPHPPPPPPSHPHPPPPPPSHPHPPPPPPSHPHPPPPPSSHPPPPPSHYPPPPTPSHPVPPPPAKPPVQPPSHPPVKPPVYPPLRKKVAVQGVVYCKSCKYRGYPNLLGVGASPLAGAVVKLECNNTRRTWRELKKTDKKGYFLFMPQSLTTSGSHKCKVSLVSSPLAKCSVPTNLHSGASGALLFRGPKPPKPFPFDLFTVGPFAFEPHKKLPCH